MKAENSSADTAVSTAQELLDQARSIGAQGATATATTATRTELAERMRSIQEQMVALANTSLGGRYIFSGDHDNAPPYRLNLSQLLTDPQNGVDRLLPQPTIATRRIELADQSSTAVDQTGQDLFDHRNTDDTLASDNVFAALNSLRVALATPADPNFQTKIASAQAALEAAANYLNTKQTFYGNVQNRISAAVTRIKTESIQLQKQVADVRETDMVQAALELSEASTQNQAAMSAAAKMPHTSLFDFLG